MNKSGFFKYLERGGRVRMITWHGQALPSDHRLAQVRTVVKVQTNAVKFNDESWLYRNDVKADEINDIATGDEWPSVNLGWATYVLVDDPKKVLA